VTVLQSRCSWITVSPANYTIPYYLPLIWLKKTLICDKWRYKCYFAVSGDLNNVFAIGPYCHSMLYYVIHLLNEAVSETERY